MLEQKKKVTFNKGGSGSSSCRVILPSEMVKLIGLNADETDVIISYNTEEKQIIIEKNYGSFYYKDGKEDIIDFSCKLKNIKVDGKDVPIVFDDDGWFLGFKNKEDINLYTEKFKSLEFEDRAIITKESEMFFIAAYYDDREFKIYEDSDFELLKNPAIYTLEEVLKLAYVENVIENYEDMKEDEELEFEELTVEEKAKLIVDYVQDDEVATVESFISKEEAEVRLKEFIKEINEIEGMIRTGELVMTDSLQNSDGHWRDEYVLADKK